MKIYEVIPGKLYQRGDTRNVKTEEKLHDLWAYDIDTVVSLYKRDPDLFSSNNIYYLECPISDGKRPPHKATFNYFLAIATMRILEGHKVLVNCHGGRNRASLFSAIVAKRVLEISGKEAVNLLRTARPNAFGNEYFAELVETDWL